MTQKIPRLAVINSFAGFGRISITAALPIISIMQVQACPLPTAVLSSHLAYSPCYKADFTVHMREYADAWEAIGLQFDGLYVGYVSNPQQLDIVNMLLDNTSAADASTDDIRTDNLLPRSTLSESLTPPSIAPARGLLKPGAKILIDPVMGDHGKAYSTVTPEQVNKMKQLMQKAHLLTPNLTEACMLTDTPYHTGYWSGNELQTLCRKLDPSDRMQIVITGIHEDNAFRNFLWDKGNSSSLLAPSAGASRPGTGDMFAAILSANALKNKDFSLSVQQASDFISACIRDSEEAKIPIKEGVLFEQNLSRLL